MRMLKFMVLLSASASVALMSGEAAARPVTPDDLVGLRRISAPAVSGDGAMTVYTLRETDLAANKGITRLWLIPSKGGAPRRLTRETAASESDGQFSPDGRYVYFLRSEGESSQVWRAPVDGKAAATPVTEVSAPLSGFRVSPDGARIALWADLPAGATEMRIPAASTDQGSGRTYDALFVRHWDQWTDGKRSQIFVAALADGRAATPRAVAPGLIGDVPSKPMGGGEEIAWAPDGRTLYFALRQAGANEAISTNLDLFAVDVTSGGAPVNLTSANPATDTLPAPSPDGRTLAYVAMKRPGYEADQQGLQIRDLSTGKVSSVAAQWDRSVNGLAWSADGRSLYVTATDHFDGALFRVDPASGQVTRLTDDGTVHDFRPLPGGDLILTRDSLVAPGDLYRLTPARKTLAALTHVNADKLAGVDMPVARKFSFTGAGGDTVWAYMVSYAPDAPARSVPVAYLVHGGPQGTFGNGWSYRWNAAVFAGHGYGAVMVDFHGSTGYGQAFTDAINRDWGGKPLEDLKLGLKAAGDQFAPLDTSRACALGGSYGGYMMAWIAGQWPDGFRCLVDHAGVFDLRTMAFETDELWFDEWEQGGPWWTRKDAERWNPVNHVAKWRTPMLIIHGERDYRVPVSQGLSAFTALQRQGLPSRMVVFPDENHWILKPKNSLQWYREVFGWTDRWTGAAK